MPRNAEKLRNLITPIVVIGALAAVGFATSKQKDMHEQDGKADSYAYSFAICFLWSQKVTELKNISQAEEIDVRMQKLKADKKSTDRVGQEEIEGRLNHLQEHKDRLLDKSPVRYWLSAADADTFTKGDPFYRYLDETSRLSPVLPKIYDGLPTPRAGFYVVQRDFNRSILRLDEMAKQHDVKLSPRAERLVESVKLISGY